MKRRRWVFGAAAVAGVIALIAPAVGQGKANSTSLRWSASREDAAITSYNLGVVDESPPVTKGFRLWTSSSTGSGQLKIKLTGSSAFALGTDSCTGRSIGKKTACWVGVVYKPRRTGTSDRATLTARGGHGGVASVTISGSGAAPSPGHVYWVGESHLPGNGTVNEMSRGGGVVSTLAGGQYAPSAVAVDGTHVYWDDAANGTVSEAPLGGGSVNVLASGQKQAGPLAVDGTNVYWVAYVGGTVNEVPVGGGSVTTLASGQSGPLAIVADGTHVYWSTSDGAVNEVPVGGGSVTTLATGQSAQALAVDGTDVYWVNGGDGGPSYPEGGTVNKVPIGGGAVTALATNQDHPSSVAVDGTHVYWSTWGTDPLGGTLSEVPLGGGTVTTLASQQTYPRSLAVDGTHVYWLDGAEGWKGFDRVKKLRLGSSSPAILKSGPSLEAVAVGP